ncbi:hypothetical protein CHS0354_023133 [Potamilus streckersoni]|uniref:C-type lectin domain-containing protein n=1 Tax=Potamilus streckersoni TaxID=2493646 RepID=A0AAE0VH82_9BIVA|nr:hypothetical protein CHS0354_023133 [Potamilus streckersoni]
MSKLRQILLLSFIFCFGVVESSYRRHRRPNLIQRIEMGLNRIWSHVGKKICPEQYDLYAGDGGPFCYKIITEFCKNWTSARELCLAEGADLMTFTEKNFQEFREIIKDLYNIHAFECGPYAWVGATDATTDSVWLLVTGARLVDNSVMWATGEPGLGSSGKNCGILDGANLDFYMADENCEREAIPICQLILG